MIVRLNLNDLASKSETFRIELAEICEEPDVLSELSRDKSTLVLIAVAQNRFTKKEDQIRLANDPDSRVQCAAVQNPQKYPEVIKTLLEKGSVVKIELAESTAADTDILDVLAEDSDYRVREAVSQNSQTRNETLFKLAEDPKVDVRLTMAKWEKTKTEIRKKLANDPDENVRNAIAGRQDNTSEDLRNIAIGEKSISVLKTIARSQITDGDTLDELIRVSPDLWLYVSENPNTLTHTLDMLAKSQSIDVLIAVIKHKNTSNDTLCIFKNHENSFIRNLAYFYLFRRKR